ncbi:hypothetical protein EUGRSUZ_G00412 [Eucalyptus grandis]|uniref:Uncharacterized protein n=2 Tax=Eucalyptus grandis TaxID=71139 RepID=A0ACC3K107_EUCGR|nr:hypothetical protein EUGRSUZ_G00412 [Eucalyptus grandis]
MVDIVVSVAAKVAEYLVAPVGRQCGYVIFTNSYVGQLQKELEKLDEVKVGMQRSVNDAEDNMMEIRLEVNRWKNDAENSTDKARVVLDKDGRATNKTCFCGWLPNPKERYLIGRDARKTALAIQALILQGKFERVYYERAPAGHVPGASDKNLSAGEGGDTITDSRASIFQDIVKALDDEKLKVIGVYGPGGVGKTTLLEEVEKKLKKEGRPFHMIAKAKVSQTQDLNKIQDDIAYFFGLNLKDEPSKEGRRDLLCRRLQKDPSDKILIILDDLWDKLDLKAVGIPLVDESRGCKLLLTSRFKDVLEKEMGADRTFLLQGLKDDKAFRLFENEVGDKLKGNEELKLIADQVIKKLAGLPLLIISVANTLKSSDESAWRNALIVRLSYDHLKSEDAKYLFVLCGLIGGTIQVELLFVLAMGLGLFERFNKTIQVSRDRLSNMLNELRSACLLLDGGNDKGNVTIHDLYSEVVISAPFRGHNSLMMNSNCGSWPKEKLEKCWAICLTDVGKDRLAEIMTCRFRDLKHVVSTKKLALDARTPTWYHCDVGDVAVLGKLKALQILSFVGSRISKLPKEIGELTNMRSLNLSNCRELKIIEFGVLKSLIKLEELHMKESFNRWTGKDETPFEFCNAKLAEFKSLRKIASLEILIPNPNILLEDADLPFKNLIRFWINIGDAGGSDIEGLRTMKLRLEGNDSILSKEWVQKNLYKTQYLHLDGLREFKKTAHELCIKGFPQLKHLIILNSPSIRYIASSSNDLLIDFVMLESLFLDNLINLEKICHGLVAPECFSTLKAVSVKKCDRLKNLWCLSEMQRIIQLKDIKVWDCDSMRAIILDDVREDKVAADDIVQLLNVRCLDLQNLPNMMSFCSGAEITSEDALIKVTFPNIQILEVEGLQCKELWNNQIPDHSFSELGFLKLKDCDNLQHIAPSYLWKRLHRSLYVLEVISCRSIEIIYEGDGIDIECGDLRRLVLHDLGNLRHIWQSDGLPNVPFPKLRDVEVKRCSRLEMLFPTFTVKFLGQIKDLMVVSCENMELIAGHEIGEEATRTTVTFSKLISLGLFKLPKFKGILPERYSLKLPRSKDFPSSLFFQMVDCGVEKNRGYFEKTLGLVRRRGSSIHQQPLPSTKH